MADRLCRDCRHIIAPRRWFGLAEPDWSSARCAKSIPSWTNKVTGAVEHGAADTCSWERIGGILRKPGGCGPEARYFQPKDSNHD